MLFVRGVCEVLSLFMGLLELPRKLPCRETSEWAALLSR
jgi:hypothetical protein